MPAFAPGLCFHRVGHSLQQKFHPRLHLKYHGGLQRVPGRPQADVGRNDEHERSGLHRKSGGGPSAQNRDPSVEAGSAEETSNAYPSTPVRTSDWSPVGNSARRG